MIAPFIAIYFYYRGLPLVAFYVLGMLCNIVAAVCLSEDDPNALQPFT